MVAERPSIIVEWTDELSLNNASIAVVGVADGGVGVWVELELELGQGPSPGASSSHARGGLAGVQVTAAIREAGTQTGPDEATC